MLSGVSARLTKNADDGFPLLDHKVFFTLSTHILKLMTPAYEMCATSPPFDECGTRQVPVCL